MAGWLGIAISRDGKASAAIRTTSATRAEVWAGPIVWKQMSHSKCPLHSGLGRGSEPPGPPPSSSRASATPRCPQGLRALARLEDLGVPTELVVYPDEGHRFVKPEDDRDRYRRICEWFARYLK